MATITIRMGSAHNDVVVSDRGDVQTFDRAAMNRDEKNRLRHSVREWAVHTGLAKPRRQKKR